MYENACFTQLFDIMEEFESNDSLFSPSRQCCAIS